MKISGFGSISSTSSTSKRGAVSGTGSFADLMATGETADAAPVNQTGDVAAMAALNNLLALQEISEEDIKRKKLVQQGHSMLDTLDSLRKRILVGTLTPGILQDIGRQISIQKQAVDDPRINAIMEDIELRAAVELAKLQKALEDRTK